MYPTQAFLDASIAHGELFLAELDGVLAGCMVLNHAYNDGYAAVIWAALCFLRASSMIRSAAVYSPVVFSLLQKP